MNRIFKLLTIILVMFVFVTSVSAVTITTNNSVSGTVDTSSKLVTNTGTITVTNVGTIDSLKMYKVVDVFYNSTTNNVTYEFTTLFKAYLNSTNGNSPDYHSLTVDQYMALTGSSTSSGTVPTTSTTLDALMSGFAQYIKTNNSLAAYTMTTSNDDATATVAAGSYLILPSSPRVVLNSVYSVMVGNVSLVPGSNNTWDIEGTTINAKKSSPSITKYFYDYRNVTCSGYNLGPHIDSPFSVSVSYRYYPYSNTLAYNKYEKNSLLAYDDGWGTNGANCQYNASYNVGEEFDYIINATLPTYPPDAINKTLVITDDINPGITFKGLNYVTIKDGNTPLTIDNNGNIKNGNIVVGTITYTAPDSTNYNSNGVLSMDLDATKLSSTNLSIQYTASLNNVRYNTSNGSFVNSVQLDYSIEPYKAGNTTANIKSVYDSNNAYTYDIAVWKYDDEYDPTDTVTYPSLPDNPSIATICSGYNYQSSYKFPGNSNAYWQTADGIACAAAYNAAEDTYFNVTWPNWYNQVAQLAGITIVESVEEPSCSDYQDSACSAQWSAYYDYKDFQSEVRSYWGMATNEGSQLTVSPSIEPYMLNGATFAIYANSTCTGSPLGTFTTTNHENDYYDYWFNDTPPSNGIGVYSGIKAGTYCIKETVAPAGYRLDNTPHVIQVGEGQTNSIAISNTAQGLLPVTGGLGTYIYMIVGAIVVVGSITMIYILNKKEKEAI